MWKPIGLGGNSRNGDGRRKLVTRTRGYGLITVEQLESRFTPASLVVHSSWLDYYGSEGEANELVITVTESSWTVSDSVGFDYHGLWTTSVTRDNWGSTIVTDVFVSVGDLDDTVSINSYVGAQVYGDEGDDELEVEGLFCEMWAGDGDDTLRGTGNADTLVGGQGNDEIHGNGGNDELYGDQKHSGAGDPPPCR
jgi:Ca2+-binding RTX toxin-like protein